MIAARDGNELANIPSAWHAGSPLPRNGNRRRRQGRREAAYRFAAISRLKRRAKTIPRDESKDESAATAGLWTRVRETDLRSLRQFYQAGESPWYTELVWSTRWIYDDDDDAESRVETLRSLGSILGLHSGVSLVKKIYFCNYEGNF